MKTILAVCATALALAATAVFAGNTQPAPLVIDLANQIASGDQVTVRYSRNDVELIGCGARVFDDGAGGVIKFGFCQARDADGVSAFCNTTNPGLVDTILGISDFSWLSFSWNDAGQCIRIGVSTQSFYLPRKLDSNL